LLRDGAAVESAGAGDDVEIILGRTPFYAEAGGQLADQGRMRVGDAHVKVLDVQPLLPGLIVHRSRVLSGEVRVGAPVYAEVDVDRRRAISRAHTATHLVHTGIRRALGQTATQAGSQNAPGRFRFDFNHTNPVPESVLRDVEAEVNAVLLDDLEVNAFITSLQQAREIGAIALFGEKYGEHVRVVEVGDYARELCGGTHAARSGQLGVVTLLGESSIGTGVRRVEALVGADAYQHLAREHILVSRLSELVKARPDDLPERIGRLIEQLRDAEREIERVRVEAAKELAPRLAAAAENVDGVLVVTHVAPDGTDADDVRRLATEVRARLPADQPAVVALGAVTDDRPAIVIVASEAAQREGLRAGDLVRSVAPLLGGGGGGRPDVAQGGGSRPEGLAQALAEVRSLVARRTTAQ
jgi:alanyl-tRNA synthetase